MTGWFGYARPFARRRRLHKGSLAGYRKCLHLAAENGSEEWLITFATRAETARVARDEITALWRDFIAHMRGGE